MALPQHVQDVRRQAELTRLRTRAAAAASPIDAMSSGFGFGDPNAQRESREQRELSRQYVGRVYTVTGVIGRTIAGRTVHVARVRRAGRGRRSGNQRLHASVPAWLQKTAAARGEELDVFDQHPLLDTLYQPNESETCWGHLFKTAAGMTLMSRCYWWVTENRKAGRKDLWYLPPTWVKPIRKTGSLLVGWELKPPSAAEPVTLPPAAICELAFPDPTNPFLAKGPTEANFSEIDADRSIVKAQRTQFRRGIWPGLAIYSGEAVGRMGQKSRIGVSAPQEAAIRASVEAAYGTLDNVGRPFIVDGRRISDIKGITNKPNEMAFGESMKGSMARVDQAFGVNPIILGLVEGVNRASSTEARKHFAEFCINPMLELMGQMASAYVAPQFVRGSETLVVWWEPLAVEDDELLLRNRQVAAARGGATVNDMRLWSGAQPLEGDLGKMLVLPASVQLVHSETGEVHELGTQMPPEPEEEEEEKSGHPRTRKSELGRDVLVDIWLRRHASQEARFVRSIERFFSKQAADIADRLSDLLDDSTGKYTHNGQQKDADSLVRQVFESGRWDAEFRRVAREHVALAMIDGALLELRFFDDLERQLGGEFGVDLDPDIEAGIERALSETLDQDYWKDIQETTRGEMIRSLQDGLQDGETLRQLQSRIRQLLRGPHAKTRAENIARTETTNSLNSGQHASRQVLARDGIVTGQEWMSTIDTSTRDQHLTADGQVVGVNDQFTLPNGERARWPGDVNLSAGNRCRCRCVAASVTPFTQRSRQLPSDVTATTKLTSGAKPPKFGESKAGFIQASIDDVESVGESLEDQVEKELGKRFTKEELASIAGAPDDANVSFSVGGNNVWVEFSGKGYRGARRIHFSDNALTLENDSFFIEEKRLQGKGLGTRVFGRQVENAARHGIKRIDTIAAGARGEDENGYYTWPRFGYDHEFNKFERQFLVSEAPGSPKRVSDLMKTPEGRQWWKENGQSINAEFDLAEGSQSRQVWERYIAEKAARGDLKSAVSTRKQSGQIEQVEQPPAVTADDNAILNTIWNLAKE